MPDADRHNGRAIRSYRTCVCGCQRAFPITSGNGRQRCFSPDCVREMRRRATTAWRVQSTDTFRRSRFGQAVQQVVKAGRIRETDLLALLAEAYDAGYHAGYRCSTKRWQRQPKGMAA